MSSIQPSPSSRPEENKPLNIEPLQPPFQNPTYDSSVAVSTSAPTEKAPTPQPNTPILDTPTAYHSTTLTYTRAVAEAIQAFKDSIYESNIADNSLKSAYYSSVLASLLALQELQEWSNNIEKVHADIQAEYEKLVGELNDQIAEFNRQALTPADQAAINDMNAAVEKFNKAQKDYEKAQKDYASGKISKKEYEQATANYQKAQGEYVAAVNKFNDYGASRNESLIPLIEEFNRSVVGAFDEKMAELNAMIDEYNAKAEIVGVPGIAYPDGPEPVTTSILWKPLSTTPPTSSVSTIPKRTDPVPLISTAEVQKLNQRNEEIQEKTNALVSQEFATYQAILDTYEVERATAEYYQNLSRIKSRKLGFVMDSTLMAETSKELLSTGIKENSSNNVVQLTQFGKTILPHLYFEKVPDKKSEALLRLATTEQLRSAGLFGAKKALQILGNGIKKIDPKGEIAALGLALGFTSEVTGDGSKEHFRQIATTIAKQNNTPPSGATVDSLIGNLRFIGALISLYQISSAIGSPDLLEQVVRLGGGSVLLEGYPSGSLYETMSDPISQKALKDKLSKVLSSENDAGQVVEQVAEGMNPRTTIEGFTKAFEEAFQGIGKNGEEAMTLTHLAISVLGEEQQHPELNSAIGRSDIITALSESTNPQISLAIENTFESDHPISQREFRNRFVEELARAGMNENNAQTLTDEIVRNLNNASSEGVAKIPGRMNVIQVEDRLAKSALGILRKELDVIASHEIYQVLQEKVLGEDKNSILSIFKSHGTEELNEMIQSYLHPTLKLHVFLRSLLDPGKSILYSAATGLMYEGNEPDNFKKSIDILI